MALSEYVHGDFPEIIIGLVGPTGIDLGDISDELVEALEYHGYESVQIHVTDFFDRFEDEIEADLVEGREDRRIRSYQAAGNQIREILGKNDALAREACLQIYLERQGNNGGELPEGAEDEGDDEGEGRLYRTRERTAYILRSFKRPEEISLLRSVYGDAFVLIAAHAPRGSRIEGVEEKIAAWEGDDDAYEPGGQYRDAAEEVIDRDERELDKPYGQNLRHTFPLADAFLDASDEDRLSQDIERIVKLLFGNSTITPKRDEHCMFLAEASKLRSSVEARQVGACLANDTGDVLSVGCNDVPSPEGGLYWSDHRWHDNEEIEDARDYKQEGDTVRERREQTLREVIEGIDALQGEDEFDWIELDIDMDQIEDGVDDLLDRLGDENARVAGLIEFFRTTHAEMEALLSASRRGQGVKGAVLYSTTFPCHECTRHIVTAGIDRVVYIEPYPKSLGPDLHEDAVAVDEGKEEGEDYRIPFEQFTGIGPRLYRALLTIEKRKNHGYLAEEDPPDGTPVVGLREPGPLLNEADIVSDYVERIDENVDDFEI